MFDIYNFLTYLNTHERETSYSKIILYLLTHTEEVPKLTISEIAQQCYVSPATLTRFSRHFQFDSFASLRKALTALISLSPYNALRMNTVQFQLLKEEPESYLKNYSEEITTAVQDVLQTIDIRVIDELLQEIHNASTVVLIGYSATLELAKDIQTSLLSSKKVVFLGETEDLQQKLITSLDKQSVIIVISSYGTLLTKSPELVQMISQSPAKSVFITQNTKNMLTNQFSQTIHVTTENYVQIGTYPLTFFFDYFTRRYAALYGS
ncbi:MurR/RpiR family transcriptional regulator [Enterococcus sp. LJL128]|uniref:MurR/RpiR family transcriptional regulator n=1 Tax=Enterococcus sp. LJL51 TaxID=3416656 RepID=UPI003CF41179